MPYFRLTTPGFLLLALAAICIGIFAATRTVGEPQLATVELPAAAPATAAATPSSFNPALIYQERSAGVVTIDAVFSGESIGGTGFVIDRQGYILTSSHVVVDFQAGAARASSIYIDFPEAGRVQAQLVGLDMFNDIAVLKVDPREVELQPVPLGDSDKVVPGEPVAAIGAPFGNQGSLSIGIVSATRRAIDSQINAQSQIADAIQTDAAINHGNSGGPLFNARGEVIGINQQIRTTSGVNEGVGFAIPINTARRAFRQIRDEGKVRYALLGLNTATVTPQLAREHGLKAAHGALVDAVSGPAQEAGLSAAGPYVFHAGRRIRLGDHIVALANVKVETKDDISRIASRLDVNQKVEVVFYRNGQRQTAWIVTGEKPL